MDKETSIIIMIVVIIIIGIFLIEDIEFFSKTDDIIRCNSWQSPGN